MNLGPCICLSIGQNPRKGICRVKNICVLKIFDEYSQIIMNTKSLSYELKLVRNFDIGISVYIYEGV